MAIAPWRARLQPASFNGVVFHMDMQSRASGRRIALHEFPKRDIPYSEDMGRQARKFGLTAYVIGPTYTFTRDELVIELEREGPGQLQLPTELNQDVMSVVVQQYAVTERREQGGYAVFEITFVEAGIDTANQIEQDSQAQVNSVADAGTNGADSSPTALSSPPQTEAPATFDQRFGSWTSSSDISRLQP